MKSNKNPQSEIEEILGNPTTDEWPESSNRIRRNLMIFSSIALLYWWTEIEVSPQGLQLAGFTFKSITNNDLKLVLKLLVIYHAFHFSMIAAEQWFRLKIRVTGTFFRPGPGAVLASKEGDYHSDPKQSTLYSWYKSNVKNLNRSMESYHEKISELIKLWKQEAENQQSTVNLNHCQKAEAYLGEINQNIKELANGRIQESLKRFDKSFDCYIGIQKSRWLVIELGLPLILAIWAFWVL